LELRYPVEGIRILFGLSDFVPTRSTVEKT